MGTVAILVSLLVAVWGARGEPPGRPGHIPTSGVIHFPGDSLSHYKAGPVQGLQYFATGTTGGVPGLQAQQLLVYPGGGVGAGHIFIPTQINQNPVITGTTLGTQAGQIIPVPSYSDVQPPTNIVHYGNTHQTGNLASYSHIQQPASFSNTQQSTNIASYSNFHQPTNIASPESYRSFQQPTNINIASPESYRSFQQPTNINIASPESYKNFQQPTNINIASPESYRSFQQPTNINIASPESYKSFQQPTNINIASPESYRSFQQPTNINIASPESYRSFQQTNLVPGVSYAPTQPITPSTPYGSQPPHGIYHNGVRPLAPGFLYSTPSSVNNHHHHHQQEQRPHQNVDITFDSLGESSQNAHAQQDSYLPPSSQSYISSLHSNNFGGSPLTSPSPMKAATYGPPAPMFGPHTRPRRPSYILDPHYHPHPLHHKGYLGPRGPLRHTPPPAFLRKPHYPYTAPTPVKPPYAAYSVPRYHHFPHGGYTGNGVNLISGEITKAIYHADQPPATYAPYHNQYLTGKSDMEESYEQEIGNGEAVMHGQYEMQPSEENSNSYATIIGTFLGDSLENSYGVGGKRTDDRTGSNGEYPHTAPGVRANHKLEMDNKGQSTYQLPHARSDSDTPSGSTMPSVQSNWRPLNAPVGAIPAKAYDIQAPDLSSVVRGSGPSHIYSQGESDSKTLMRPNYQEKYYYATDHHQETKSNPFRDTSEVVSAVVLVKQK